MTRYEEIAGSDADDWFSVDESVGEVMLNRRLDFDTMENKVIDLGGAQLLGKGVGVAFMCCRDKAPRAYNFGHASTRILKLKNGRRLS